MPIPTFLLIGNGFIAPRHLAAIKHVGGLVLEHIDEHPDLERWRSVIKNSRADYVVILTPNYLHFEMCRLAAETGKKVLCEKPLCIRSEDVRTLSRYPDIFTVLQLRHHPLVQKIKEKIASSAAAGDLLAMTAEDSSLRGVPRSGTTKQSFQRDIQINISVFRDRDYYSSWKGDKTKSGGLLFNLGIHYFDLLIHLFGAPAAISAITNNEKTATGVLESGNYTCHWKISSEAERDKQQRSFIIDGANYNFSSQDNLSYEDLHKKVYEDLVNGVGASPIDVLPATILVERLYGI